MVVGYSSGMYARPRIGSEHKESGSRTAHGHTAHVLAQPASGLGVGGGKEPLEQGMMALSEE